jgi:copper chaperone CopZ
MCAGCCMRACGSGAAAARIAALRPLIRVRATLCAGRCRASSAPRSRCCSTRQRWAARAGAAGGLLAFRAARPGAAGPRSAPLQAASGGRPQLAGCRLPRPLRRPAAAAQVEYDGSKLEAKALVEAVEDAGFDAELLEDSRASAQAPQVARLQVRGPALEARAPAAGTGGSRRAQRSQRPLRSQRSTQGPLRCGAGRRALPGPTRPHKGHSATHPSGPAQIFGMSCASCSSAVEGALREVRGVRKAGVSLAQGEAEVEYDPGKAELVGAPGGGARRGGGGAHQAVAPAGAGLGRRLLPLPGGPRCGRGPTRLTPPPPPLPSVEPPTTRRPLPPCRSSWWPRWRTPASRSR